MFNLYVAGYLAQNPFKFKQDRIIYTSRGDKLSKNDGILLLPGGADISPTIYNRELHPRSGALETLSQRDVDEINLIEQAVKLGMPIIGICRGAQLLCAIDGGVLVQHILNHTSGDHLVTDLTTGEQFKTTSCHHQMMVPSTKSGAQILAIANESTVGEAPNGKQFPIKRVPEVVYFPKIKGIGIQGHPEWMHGTAFVDYCTKLINHYLLKD